MMSLNQSIVLIVLRLSLPLCFAWKGTQAGENARLPVSLEDFTSPPVFEVIEHVDARGSAQVQGILFRGPDNRGSSTRVFAWIGLPEAEGESAVPGMVLVHGGGGTAFLDWVRLWNDRGYAAIAMDLNGSMPNPREKWDSEGRSKALPDGGPAGWGGFLKEESRQLSWAVEDHWTTYCVRTIIQAHTLLRSYPGVDPHRIGMTGISWGGYLSSIVAAHDNRFRFSAQVYGTGYYHLSHYWNPRLSKLSPDERSHWLTHFDPSVYLSSIRIPTLWVTGTNDFAYPLNTFQKSISAVSAPVHVAVIPGLEHNWITGSRIPEVHAMADHFLNGGASLGRITAEGRNGQSAWAAFESEVPVSSAMLNFAPLADSWKTLVWNQVEAKVDHAGRCVRATVPDEAAVHFLTIRDERGLSFSSTYHERVPIPASTIDE
jgi:dienelactone hydrolase